MLHCTVGHPDMGGDRHVVCVHLGLREAHRRAQLEQLCALVRRIGNNAPVLIGGDFNDWRRRASPLLAACSMRDVFRGALGREPRTYRSEEHTSEPQSLMRISYAVFCLKKKTQTKYDIQKVQT